MPRLTSFINVTLDGYYAGPEGDLGWAHAQDEEYQQFVAGNAAGGGRLVFGRVTYQMMAGYWPTPLAAKNNPAVAEQMNAREKIVFSRTLGEAAWQNARLLSGDLESEIRRLKQSPGADLVVLGSGSLVAQLVGLELIDELQVVVSPVVIGAGQRWLAGLDRQLNFALARSRVFANGKVLLCYQPKA